MCQRGKEIGEWLAQEMETGAAGEKETKHNIGTGVLDALEKMVPGIQAVEGKSQA